MDGEISQPPQDCGQRLLPVLIDDIACVDPERVFAAIPTSASPTDGYEDITYHNLATAIDRYSWWIEERIGKASDFETLAFFGPLDLLYHVFTLAAIKTGYKAFLPSHRNSLEAHISLLDATQCGTVLFQETYSPLVDLMMERREMQKLLVPSLAFFLQKDEVPRYQYNKCFAEARYQPFVVLHTSGSTALPKPVVVNHGTLASMDSYQLISHLGAEPVIGPSLKGSRMLMAFPLFHMASFTLLLGYGAYYGVIGVLPPAVEPITAGVIEAVHTNSAVQGSALPPSLMVDLYHEAKSFTRLHRLEYLFYAGGSLPKEVGIQISSLTHLATLFGSTEAGYPAMKVTDSCDWQYVSYSPFHGDEFRPVTEDGLYEHFIVRKSYLDLFQGIFSTYPNESEYSTKDLYRRHPTKPGLWRFCGRIDDVIVFSNAETYNPVDFEDMISSHPAVRSALMGGQGEFQSCLLVEPMKELKDENDRTSLLENIWPAVQEANHISPAHARVMKDSILFTSKDKPPERAGKGTIQRMTTLQLYREEINRLYKSPELPKISPQVLVQPQIQQSATLRTALYQMVLGSVWLDGQLSYSADLFELGLDSLQTLALSKQINAYLMQRLPNAKPITPSSIYTYSTLEKLESFLTTAAEQSKVEGSHQKMQQVLDECSSRLPKGAPGASKRSDESPVVLLTGSTGSLGSYILRVLLKSEVQKIYCLNRGKDAQNRQTRSFESKGIKPDFQSTVFLHYDLSKPRLGLEKALYNELQQQVTHVVHNAWDINFNRPLDSFVNPHIRGVCNVIQFCVESRFNARLFFVSSESAVLGQHGQRQGCVSEQIVSDWAYAQDMGYAESKLVAERLINTASQNSNLQATICRIGQIAGPTSESGIWSTREWFPSLIASSARLEMLPDSLVSQDSVNWVPVDAVAQIIIELLFQSSHSSDSSREERALGLEEPTVKQLELASNDNASISGTSNSETRALSDQQNTPTSTTIINTEAAGRSGRAQLCEYNGLLEGGKASLGNVDQLEADSTEEHSSTIGFNLISPPRSTQRASFDHARNFKTPTVFHIVNNHPRSWLELVPVFQKACSTPLQLVPFTVWLATLQKEAESSDSVMRLQAMALLEFYEHVRQRCAAGGTVLSTANTVRASETLAALGAVNDTWIGIWMRQWGLS